MADEDLEWEEWDPSKLSFHHHMVAGSIAGLAEHVSIFPIDTLKTHIQCERCGSLSTFQTWNIIGDLVKKDGIFRLWRGVSAMFTGCIPAHAAYFSIFESMKIFVGADKDGHHPLRAAVCGASATISHDICMNPFDTIKQRMQLGYYHSFLHCVRSMIKEEGILSLYRSFPTTVLMNIPYGCVMVATNESMRKYLNPSGDYSITSSMLAGSIAGCTAALATNPLDVIKTRLQTQNLEGCPRMSSKPTSTSTSNSSPTTTNAQCAIKVIKSTKSNPAAGAASATGVGVRGAVAEARVLGGVEVFRAILAQEGWTGLFRGAIPRMLVHAPSVAISWTTYETMKNVLTTHLQS